MCAPVRTSPAAHPPDRGVESLVADQTDSGIYCNRCRYNLTGLTIPRCPECGTIFERFSEVSLPLRLEHVLLAINGFAIVMYALLLVSIPPPGSGPGGADDTVVVAMLAPLQWVLALAALIAGLHAIQNAERSWRLLTGTALPTVVAIASLASIF